jgi:acyl-CoA thioesterase YciA
MTATSDDSELAIRVMAMPADTNASGDIFGGWLMSQVDIAGSSITRVGRSSTTVNVKAYAERQGATHESIQVTEADLTYVAVDEQRRPRPLTPIS